MWYTYLLVDFFCILFPFLFSFHPKIKFYKQWKFLVLPALVTAVFFIVWDMLFTQWGVWSFNPNYVCGIYLYNLPLEEILFFFCIPYACIFTYYCCKKFLTLKNPSIAFFYGIGLLALLLATLAVFNITRLYTSVTFFFMAIFLGILAMKRVSFLKPFMISFLIILLPFFISNGILTGSFIDEPVVLYNNQYNLGIRMFTIPVEDTFYGMLLLVMNITGYEILKRRAILKT